MSNDNQSRRNIYHLQKKIVELTQQYYNAIKNNITFENVKVIFMKRKQLENELSHLKEEIEKPIDNSQEQNLDTSYSL
jgi:hemerythrin-like domain-containing protein